MKRVLFSVLIILFLVLADLNILQHIRILGKNIDLLIITLIFFNLFYNYLTFPLFIFSGILKDILGTGIFGIHTTIFAISALFMNSMVKWIAKENIVVSMLYVFIATIFILSCLDSAEFILKASVIQPKIIFLQIILPKGIVSAAVAPFWFRILSKILR